MRSSEHIRQMWADRMRVPRHRKWMGRPEPSTFGIRYIQETFPASSRILVVGCGSGCYEHHFDGFADVQAFDCTPELVDLAKTVGNVRVRYFVDDVLDLKHCLPADVAFTKVVLQHLHPHEIGVAIANIAGLCHDVIIEEATRNVRDDPDGYVCRHPYREVFHTHGMELVTEHEWDNGVTSTLHFRKVSP